MADQSGKLDERITQQEEKVNQENTLIEEMRQDVEQLQVAERLHKRLETNLDKLVNKLDAIADQIPNCTEQSSVSVEAGRLTDMEQQNKSRLDNLQQFVHYKVDSGTSHIISEFNWIKEQIKQIKEEQELISAKIDKLCAGVEEMNEIPSKDGYIWVVNGIEAKTKYPTMTEWSPVFKLYGYQFGAQAVMQAKNNDLYLYLSPKDTGHFRAFSKLKFLPRLTVALCDINANSDVNDIVKICDPQFRNSNFQYNTNYYNVFLCQKSDITPKYIFNDSIMVKIHISPPEDVEKPASTNGVLVWTVDSYQKRRKMEEDRLVSCQQSPYFYTSDKGYRVKVELELRYGTVKVRIFFVSGEFDADLTAAFSHNATVTLVDQSPSWISRNDRIVSIRKSNIQDKSYEVNLSPKSDLNDFRDNYLKDDSIVIKVEIQPSTPS